MRTPKGLADPEGTNRAIIQHNAKLKLDEIGVMVDPEHLDEAVGIAYAIRAASLKPSTRTVPPHLDAVLIVLRDKEWPHRLACERIGVDRRRAMDTYNFAVRRREVRALRRMADGQPDRG
jgi:hypothetical protein